MFHAVCRSIHTVKQFAEIASGLSSTHIYHGVTVIEHDKDHQRDSWWYHKRLNISGLTAEAAGLCKISLHMRQS